MAYDNVRSYLDSTIAAQNVIATASGQVVTVASAAFYPIAEATFVCSIAGVITATPSNFPATCKYAVLSGTTTIGSITPTQAVGSSAFATIVPPVAVAQAGVLTVSIVSTGTASATETAGAISLSVGLAPQFV